MGTPCVIGMKQADGSGRAIRCNYDGDVAGAGVILAGWYTEPTKTKSLLALGDLSQLGEELDTCVAYHRDRHEPMRPARRFASVDDYQHLAEAEMSADYLYVYDDGKWLVYGLYNVSEWIHVEVKKDSEKQ